MKITLAKDKTFGKRLNSRSIWGSFLIKKLKNTAPWTYAVEDLNDEGIVGTFHEKEFKRQIKQSSDWKK